MNQVIVRHDDFDFRLLPSQYIAIHEEFVKRNITETAVLQFTQHGNLANYDPTLIEYMKTAPNWDFAIHGWSHEEYDGMDYNFIVRDLAACKHLCEKLFNKTPTIWHPPWNRFSIPMERAAKFLDMTINNESYDIAKFIREVEANEYKGHSFYFHGWKADEMMRFQEALDCVEKLRRET